MCQPRSEGGRRCPDYERLKDSSASDFAPAPVDGLPDVTWRDEDLSKTWGSGVEDRVDGCVALLALQSVKAVEPEMTQSVMSVAHQAGGKCSYLESRVKSPASLARKIRSDRDEAAQSGVKLSPETVVAKLSDVVRYTIVRQDHAGLTDTAASAVASLQSRGWRIERIKSSYEEGAAYKGLHIICKSPSGNTAEVQVHSAESLAAKEAAHRYYEIYRDDSLSKKERDKAKAECVRLFSTVGTPPGLDFVGALGRRDIARVPVENPNVRKS